MQVLRASFGIINIQFYIIHFLIFGFHDIGINFVSKKNQNISYFCYFFFFVYLLPILIIEAHILHYWCLKKAQSNIFTKIETFMASTAFSGKFLLNFCLLSFCCSF